MALFRFYPFRLATVLAAFAVLIGCTHTLKTSKIPTLQAGSPLKGISPKIFAFKEFRDLRPTDDPFLVSVEPYGHKMKLDQPAATVVATAVRKELERNGHTSVLDSPNLKSDFLVEGTVNTYFYIMGQRVYYAKVAAKVKMELRVSRVSLKERVLKKSYQGEYSASNALGITWGMKKDVLNQALLEMVKEMSTDPELIAFLKEAPEAKPTTLEKEITNVGLTSKKEPPLPEKEVSKDRPAEKEKPDGSPQEKSQARKELRTEKEVNVTESQTKLPLQEQTRWFLGLWRGILPGKNETRLLEILTVKRLDSRKMEAKANYGITGRKMDLITMTLFSEQNGTIQISFTTPADSKVKLQKASETRLEGTFETKDGKRKTIRYWKEGVIADINPKLKNYLGTWQGKWSEPGSDTSRDAKVTIAYIDGTAASVLHEWEAVTITANRIAREYATTWTWNHATVNAKGAVEFRTLDGERIFIFELSPDQNSLKGELRGIISSNLNFYRTIELIRIK